MNQILFSVQILDFDSFTGITIQTLFLLRLKLHIDFVSPLLTLKLKYKYILIGWDPNEYWVSVLHFG